MNLRLKASDIDIRDAFFDELYKIAAEDSNVVFLTADMGALSLKRFKKDLSAQYINVGAAEQNLISIGAGLALSGKRVFVYAMTPFITQRCYEQIRIDLCRMRLPVTIIGAGPGITYSSDGPTHYAIEDIAIMRALPGISILSPCDSVFATAAARTSYKSDGPVYVRLDKDKQPIAYKDNTDEDFFSDGLFVLKPGRDMLLIATGVMVHHAFKVSSELAKHSIDAGILYIYKIKPFNTDMLLEAVKKIGQTVILEEHSVAGGIGSIVLEALADRGSATCVKRIGIADKYIEKYGYGDRDWMHAFYGLDIESVKRNILNWLKKDNGR